jgi:hypothetical protein
MAASPLSETALLIESTRGFLSALDAFQESYAASHSPDPLARALLLDWLLRFARAPKLQAAHDRLQLSEASLHEAYFALSGADPDLRFCLVSYLRFWDSMESLESRLAIDKARSHLEESISRVSAPQLA